VLGPESYLNDMDGRRILEKVMPLAPDQHRWSQRVREADAAFRRYVVPSEECIWGTQVAKKNGYSRQRDWWYYHRPAWEPEDWFRS
jgi:hypothetical protein